MDKNSEKKNILFVCIGINTGGIERALINILNIIDYSKYNEQMGTYLILQNDKLL